ncbi:hypothetical protein ACFXP3_28950 [Streptomyces sp. NPDC059096]|uniref:hypothetical protein n=1 Tax=Streptomyces sp. NPDC059096 TaxID=3346727 RepID=UPI00368559BC
MADERDAWLDKDAAERLLRGEPVEAPDARALARQERLTGALRDMSAVTYANDEELPGEAAALAAFRQAGAPDAATDLLGTVRLALAPEAAGTRWRGRPLSRGLVVAVAGCALGGFTVVAGATVLPSLFGAAVPGPASSVSAGASPRPLSSGSTDRGQDRSAPSPDRPSADGAGGRAPVGPSSPGPTGDAARGGDGGTGDDARGEAVGYEAATGRSADGPRAPFVPHTDPASGAWYQATVDACRDFRSGAIDPGRRKALDAAADEPGGTERYCDRLLDGELRSGGKDRDGGDKDRNGYGKDRDGGGKDRDGHGEDGGQDGHGEDGDGEDEGGQSGNEQPQLTPAPPNRPTMAPPTYGAPAPEAPGAPGATRTPEDPGTPQPSATASEPVSPVAPTPPGESSADLS